MRDLLVNMKSNDVSKLLLWAHYHGVVWCCHPFFLAYFLSFRLDGGMP